MAVNDIVSNLTIINWGNGVIGSNGTLILDDTVFIDTNDFELGLVIRTFITTGTVDADLFFTVADSDTGVTGSFTAITDTNQIIGNNIISAGTTSNTSRPNQRVASAGIIGNRRYITPAFVVTNYTGDTNVSIEIIQKGEELAIPPIASLIT